MPPLTSTLSTLFLLFLTLNLSYQDELPQTPIEPNYQEDVSINNNDNTLRFYKINLQNLPDETDLSISITSQDNTSPKIYVSYQDHNPQEINTADHTALMPHGGIIWIPHNKLRNYQEIYMGLICSGRCSARLLVEYSTEIITPADGILRHYEDLENSTSAVIRLFVPDNPDADRIVIHADAIPEDVDTTPALEMLINKGDRLPDTSNAQLIPQSGWFEGRTAVIYRGTELFETNSKYTLTLKFAKGSYLSFQASVMEVFTPLRNGYVLDAVQDGKTNTYTYQLVEAFKDKDILIDVSPQKGTLSIVVLCDSNPQAQWSYKISARREDIVLTNKEHAVCSSNLYQILVTSDEPAVYNIRAIARDPNHMFLVTNDPVTGTIDPAEAIQYEFSVPLFTMEKIEIVLNTTGKVNMTVLNCKFPNDCPAFTPDLTKHPDVGSELQEFTFETNTYEGIGQTIVIDPHNGGCYPILVDMFFMHSEPMPICAYKINISSFDSNMAHYSLIVISQGHDLLLLSTPLEDIVSANTTLYYVMNVANENTSSVTFQLTTFSGHAEMFVSRVQEFPSEDPGEAQLEHEGFVVFQNTSNLTGRYYIAVTANQTTSFTLTGTATDINGKKEEDAIFMTEGVPHKGVLLPQHEFPGQYYKLDVNLEDDWSGVLSINTISMKGRLLIVVSTETKTPNPMMNTWSSDTGVVQINSTDPNFERKGTYYVSVTVDWSDGRAYSQQELVYLIYYHIAHKDAHELANVQHIILTTFSPFSGTVQPNQTIYFKVFILPDEKKITVIKQADSGDVDLYVSTSTHNVYPDSTNYNISTKDTHENRISLNTTDFEEACKDKVGNKLCEFNFAVMTSSQQQVSFTVTLEREARDIPDPTPLQDGKQGVFSLPEDKKPALFYFYPSPNRDSFIEVSCPHKEIEIYANSRKVVISAVSKMGKVMPTPDANDFHSLQGTDLETGFAHLMIPGDQDSNSTVITLAVYFKNGYSASQNKDIDKIKTFTIVATSHIIEMYMGKPVLSHVAEDTYQYYFFNVHRQQANLLISLTTLDDGDPDLLVSQGWIYRPTIEDHTFASISAQGTELLKITPLDIYPKNSMEGIWVVGVYGRSESRFALTVVYEDRSIIDLQQGIPMEMYLAANSKVYFKYHHVASSDFDVTIDQMSGDLTAYVRPLGANELLENHLPGPDSSTWTIQPNREGTLKIKGDCDGCIYLIGLEIKQSSKFIITVLEEQEIMRISSSIVYENTLKPKQSKKYMFFATNYDEIDLDGELKSGSLTVSVVNNPAIVSSNSLIRRDLTLSSPSLHLKISKDGLKVGPQVVSVGETEILSLKNVIFFSFENNGDTPARYTFSVNLDDGSPILKLGKSQEIGFGPLERKYFVYYSPHTQGITTLDLSYCTLTVAPKTDRENDFAYSQVLEGFDVEIRFWPQRLTAGKGEELSEVKNDIYIENTRGEGGLINVCVKQTIVVDNEDEEGRYEFGLKNPVGGNMLLNLRVDTSEVKFKVLDKNYRNFETIKQDETVDFEILIPSKGVWYFGIVACQGQVQVIMGDSLEALDAQASGGYSLSGIYHPKQFKRNIAIPEAGIKYVRLKGVVGEGGFNGGSIDYHIYSMFFPEDQYYEYRPVTQNRFELFESGLTHDYDYSHSELTVNFDPVEFEDVNANDQLDFLIRVCPQETLVEKNNYCLPFYKIDGCTFGYKEADINKKSPITQKFSKVMPGKYYIQIAGTIHHQSVMTIPFAYELYEAELKTSLMKRAWDFIYIPLIVIGVIVCLLLAYRTLRRAGAAKKLNSARNYEFVQEEEGN